MHLGAVTLVSSVAGALAVLLPAVVLLAMRQIRRDVRTIRQRFEAEQRRREEIRHQIEDPDEAPPRRLRLVRRKLPPTLLLLSALPWELVKRHPVPSLGLTSAAAGLAASAVLITPAVHPPGMTNPGPATGPTPVVHVPAPRRTTPVRKEAVPVGTQPPEVPTGPPMSPAAVTATPTPTPTTRSQGTPVTVTVVPPLTPSVATPRRHLPTRPRVCITVVRIPVCT